MAYVPYAVTYGDRYELVGPDGWTAVFNEDTHPNYVGMLTEVTGLDSPEVRESAQDIVEGDGGVHGNFYFSRRPITMSARIFGHGSLLERETRIDRARRATIAMRADAMLKWKPITRRENWIENPTFAGGVITPWNNAGSSAGWASGVTNTYSATGGVSNGPSLRVQATMPADTTTRAAVSSHKTQVLGNYIPVVPGRSYTFSGVVNHSVAPALGSRAGVYWFKADGTASSISANTHSGFMGAGSTGSFTATMTGTAPADAVLAQPRVRSETNVSGAVIDSFWDNLIFTETAMGTTFFSGADAGFYWQGTPNQSASGDFVEMFVPVRRQQPFSETGQWIKEIQMSLVSEFAVIQSAAQSAQGANTGVAASAENRGSYPVYPIVEFTGSGVNPTMNDGHGNIFTTGPSGNTLTLAGGEVVQFDMLNHSGAFTAGARVGQSANRYINFATTAWPNLRGGTTESFTGANTGTWRILWRDAWV
jgi:hypothetical protein